jgi:hypothetical protein
VSLEETHDVSTLIFVSRHITDLFFYMCAGSCVRRRSGCSPLQTSRSRSAASRSWDPAEVPLPALSRETRPIACIAGPRRHGRKPRPSEAARYARNPLSTVRLQIRHGSKRYRATAVRFGSSLLVWKRQPLPAQTEHVCVLRVSLLQWALHRTVGPLIASSG